MARGARRFAAPSPARKRRGGLPVLLAVLPAPAHPQTVKLNDPLVRTREGGDGALLP